MLRICRLVAPPRPLPQLCASMGVSVCHRRVSSAAGASAAGTQAHWASRGGDVAEGTAALRGSAVMHSTVASRGARVVLHMPTGVQLWRDMPRTGWRVSRTVFGGDTLGVPSGARVTAMQAALASGTCNMVQFSVSDTALRTTAGSDRYERDSVAQFWEGHALHDSVESGVVSRDGVVVVFHVHVGNTGHPASVSVSGLAAQLQAALEWYGMPSVDMVMAHIPSDTSQFNPDTDVPALMEALEDTVAAGATQYYGVQSAAFTALELRSYSGSAKLPAQPLRRVFMAAEAMCADHHLAAVAYNLNLGHLEPVLPAFARSEADTPRSLATLVHDYGVTQLAHRPFDVTQFGRPLRLADVASTDTDDAGLDMNGEAIASVVRDALNVAVHLEQEFVDSVRDAAAAYKADDGSRPAQSVPQASEQDASWARAIMASLNHMDSLAEWQGTSHYRVARAVDRVVQYAGSTSDAARKWALAYKMAMVELVAAVTAMHQLHHPYQLGLVRKALVDQDVIAADNSAAPMAATVSQLLLSTPVDAIVTELPEAFTPAHANVAMSAVPDITAKLQCVEMPVVLANPRAPPPV